MSEAQDGKDVDVHMAVVTIKQAIGHERLADYYRLLLQSIGEGICGLDTQGNITYLNPAAARMLRLEPGEAIGKSMHALAHYRPGDDATHPKEMCPICRTFQMEQGCQIDHEVFWRRDRTSFPVEYSSFPLREGDTEVGVVITFADLTERKIHAQEMLYTMASAQCLLWYADVQFVSEEKPLRWFMWPVDEEAARRFLPIPIEVGQTFAQAYYACRLDEDKQRTNEFGRAAILAGRNYHQEYRCRRADGEVRWISENVQVEKVAEGRWRAALVCTDITELKRREHEIEVLNHRLQRAMTETHHRVKNNLQIIAAMVDMQLIDSPENVPLAELYRLSQHVRTLAAVHDILTQEARTAGQMDSVSARAILGKLLPMMQQTAGGHRLYYALDDARLSSRQGTSLALITNELVSNAIKHGKGKVEINFICRDDTATLEVCDDGSGFPIGFDPATAANTGLDLVHNLARWDLQGTITFDNRAEAGGGRVAITFPLPADTPSA